MADKKLIDFNLREEKDKLVRLKIYLDKSKHGCGQRFEYGNYIHGEICRKDCLCDDCTIRIEENKDEVRNQETLILSIQLAKNGDVVGRIKYILVSELSYEDQIKKIRSILNE